uniref:ARAD1D24310p n=1 Tax=Blastobotrys adeninivorans TaxID=409370 RepID=A0A060TA47_BLAAD
MSEDIKGQLKMREEIEMEVEMGEFVLRRIDPWNDPWARREWAEISLGFLDSFEGEPLAWHQYGARYHYGLQNYKEILSIGNQKERIDKLQLSIGAYERLLHTQARTLRSKYTRPGRVSWALYEKSTNRLIGFSGWIVPNDMRQEFDLVQGKHGVVWTMFKWITDTINSWIDWLTYLWEPDHPLHNRRWDQFDSIFVSKGDMFINGTHTVEELAVGDKVKDHSYLIYPEAYRVFLNDFFVVPQYQRMGLGKIMLQLSLDQIPVRPVTFEHNGQYRQYPQVVSLYGSEEGVSLYRKCGFQLLIGWDPILSGIRVPVYYMQLIRPATSTTSSTHN